MRFNVRYVLAAVLLFVLGYRLNSVPASGTLHVSERAHSFGSVTDTQTLKHTFVLTNTGDDPLTITDVHASCGCTVPELTKKTIAGGDTAHLNVTLNVKGKGKGPIEKTIRIQTDSRTTPSDSISVAANITALHAGLMMTVDNIFKGECRKCHVTAGEGKFALALFQADCSMCHVHSPKSHTVDMLGIMAKKHPPAELRKIIADGKPGTNMPAFASAQGGPLSDEQIESLVNFLQRK